MAFRSGSFSRSLLNNARSSLRSSQSQSHPRLRPPPIPTPLRQQQHRRFSISRTFGELGCAQSLMPLHSVVAAARLTSHLTVNARSCCELSQVQYKKETLEKLQNDVESYSKATRVVGVEAVLTTESLGESHVNKDHNALGSEKEHEEGEDSQSKQEVSGAKTALENAGFS
ncbi:hypothetical protein IFM89_005062 [Coptis chinensis]|uniref:Uncharacterized protein n=1 Tax=Coptis chinensis TaxID=261450 RepID=A0A835HNR2_9MAGN|nr:hypothetical protein IFM89_005062 [Coptis chinensis]